jgi:hypothetical protein
MGKKTIQSKSSSLHPEKAKINTLLNHLPPLKVADPKTDVIMSMKMLTPSCYHISMYGKPVETYINQSLVFPANNPKAFADQITKQVIGKIFPPDFHPEFNQYVSISSSLYLERFDELAKTNIPLPKAIEKIKSNQEDFINHEIDAVIYVNSSVVQEKWMEIKMFTCPDQSAKVINRLLQPKELKSYFLTNDYLGLMGFSLICTKDGTPVPYQKIHPKGLEGMSSWMIHFLLFDQGICDDPRPTSELADWILTQIQIELDEMTSRMDLNKYNCFFKMTENFVKVVRMAQLLEEYKEKLKDYKEELKEYKEELKQLRKAKEEERKAKEEERKTKEKYRQLLLKHGISPDEE